jgi:hypothetical protein
VIVKRPNSPISGKMPQVRAVYGKFVQYVQELQSLTDFRFFGPVLSNAAGTDKWKENDAFSGVESAVYRTFTTHAGAPEGVYSVVLDVGHTFVDTKENTVLVWPGRDRR